MTHTYSLYSFEIRRDVTHSRLRILGELPLNVHAVYGFATKTNALYGYLSEIRNLPCVASRLISKLDREYVSCVTIQFLKKGCLISNWTCQSYTVPLKK